jgi:adenylate cyclase
MAGTPAEEPDADRRRLMQRLSEMGATDEEIQDAARSGTLGPLALELALRGSEVIPFAEAAAQAGLRLEDAARLWRALGFPDPVAAPPRVTPKQVTTLRVLAGTANLLGDDAALQLAPLIGGSMARLAEAIVDSFRIHVEMPRRHQGEPSSQIVEDYSRTAAALIPPLIEAIGDLLVGHILAVARASWALDDQRAAVTRDLVVGFADLVGYTQAAQQLSPAELAGAISRFEACSGETISRHGGRVVKLIGDEVMFVVDDRRRAADLAMELLDQVAQDAHLPEIRIGLAAGPVVSHHGDYYGAVVNLAARLVKSASPGTVLASESLGSSSGGEPVELPPPKGFDHPVQAWQLGLR